MLHWLLCRTPIQGVSPEEVEGCDNPTNSMPMGHMTWVSQTDALPQSNSKLMN